MGSALLATDGSEFARAATEAALEAAQMRNGRLHVVGVVDRRVRGEPGLSSDELATIAVEDRAREHVQAVARRGAERGVEVEGAVLHGVPHERILAHAAEVDADVIVVGEHGDHDGHLGGVRRRLARQSDRDVLVAPIAD